MDARVAVALLLAALTWLGGQPGARTTTVGLPLAVDGTWSLPSDVDLAVVRDRSVVVTKAGRGIARARHEIALDHLSGADEWRLGLEVTRLTSPDAPLFASGGWMSFVYFAGDERIGQAPVVDIALWQLTAELDVLLKAPARADTLRVVFTMPGAGEWRLADLSLTPVAAAAWSGAVVVALAVGWVVLLLWLLSPAWRRRSPWGVGAVLGGLAIVVFGTGLSHAGLSVFTDPLAAVLDSAFALVPHDSVPRRSEFLVRKYGHFVAFLALSVTLWWCRDSIALDRRSLVLLCVAIALGSEALQFYADGRTPHLSDVGIDLAGTATGLVLIGLLSLSRERLRLGRAARSEATPDSKAADGAAADR